MCAFLAYRNYLEQGERYLRSVWESKIVHARRSKPCMKATGVSVAAPSHGVPATASEARRLPTVGGAESEGGESGAAGEGGERGVMVAA